MDEEVIVVECKSDGTVEISTPCTVGKKCGDLTRWLEQGLGKTTATKKTANYYKEKKAKVKQKGMVTE